MLVNLIPYIMKNYFIALFAYFIFFPQFAISQDETGMIPSEWTFCYKEEMDAYEHEFCMEWWNVNGTKVENDREYTVLSRNFGFLDGAPYALGFWRAYDLDEEGENVPIAVGDVISIREETGKVYALKNEYLSFMKLLYPDETDFYTGPSESECEVLLYDFTLNVGDRYPCIGNVRVDSVFTFITRDNVSRRGLRLENGCLLLEGIGCINSIGSLIAYQNTITRDGKVRAYLKQCRQKHDASYTDIYRDNDLYVISHIRTPLSNQPAGENVFSLSGLHVPVSSSSPSLRKGIYIRNGRKVMAR